MHGGISEHPLIISVLTMDRLHTVTLNLNVPQMNLYSLLEILNLEFMILTYLEDLNNVHIIIVLWSLSLPISLLVCEHSCIS